MNLVVYTCEPLWKMCVYVCMCKKPWPHAFKDNRFNTDGIRRLHGWIQTHLDLTGTLYITSLPTTLNWALTHSHLFRPMQTSQNTEKKCPFPSIVPTTPTPTPPPPYHLTIWATLVRNFFFSINTKKCSEKSIIYSMYRYYISLRKQSHK